MTLVQLLSSAFSVSGAQASAKTEELLCVASVLGRGTKQGLRCQTLTCASDLSQRISFFSQQRLLYSFCAKAGTLRGKNAMSKVKSKPLYGDIVVFALMCFN